MTKYVDVVAVHVANRLVVTKTGDYYPIDDLLDEDFIETDDIEHACYGICQCPDGWFRIDFDEFEAVDYYH